MSFNALGSPLIIFSAPIFLPFVGHPLPAAQDIKATQTAAKATAGGFIIFSIFLLSAFNSFFYSRCVAHVSSSLSYQLLPDPNAVYITRKQKRSSLLPQCNGQEVCYL
jgi:hypothetical protein